MTDNGVLVSRVVEEVYTLATSRYSLPFGLSKSSSREDIIEQLGDPDEIVKVDDGLGRVLRYQPSLFQPVFSLSRPYCVVQQ